MHRGGTSSVADALSRLGVYFGEPDDLFKGDSHNEEGYWEHKRINDVNRRFKLSLNLGSFDIDPVPKAWRELPLSEQFINEMVALLQKQFKGRELWGWKDPETSLLVPFTKEVFNRLGLSPCYLICVRNPLDVAASQAKRANARRGQTLGAWLRNTLTALHDTIGEQRLVVMHNQFLDSPRRSLEPLVDSIEGWLPNEVRWSEASSAVRPDLVHHQEETEQLDELPAIFSKTFELCRVAAAQPEALTQGQLDGEISGLFCELSSWMDFLRVANPSTAHPSFVWEQGTKALDAHCILAPDRSWQTLRLPIHCTPGARISAMLYHMPCEVWIRKAVWHVGSHQVPVELNAGTHGSLTVTSGIRRLAVAFGPDQMFFQAPLQRGPFELELELLIETSARITGMTFRQLTQAWDQARQLASDLEEQIAVLEAKIACIERREP